MRHGAAGVQLGAVWQKRLVLIVVAVAVLMVPIGIAQVAQRPHSDLRPYAPTNLHDAVGLFANRNHYASLLATALVFIFGGLLLNARGGRSRSVRILQMIGWMLLGAILLLGIVLSRSRAGVGLAGHGVGRHAAAGISCAAANIRRPSAGSSAS